MGKYIGIDLGTTFSVVSYIDNNGVPQIVNNQEGENIMPSAVLFEEDAVIVGSDAKSSSIVNPDNYVAFAKRNMGSKQQNYNIQDKVYTPEEISALILKKLCKDAEIALDDEILGAVITVPAYFTDAQRKSTIDAATMANLRVLAIINEPTAAALAYGISKDDSESKKVLVYDLGGGTFDVSIMQFSDKKIETLSSMGDSQLGGFDFDQVIIDWFKERALEQEIDVNQDIMALQNLSLEAEKAKKTLSSGRTKTMIALSVQGKPIRAELSKEQFEQMIEPLIYQTISIMDAAMEEANLEYSDLNRILLVGGSTRIPLVKEMIKEETEIDPASDIHPDEAVAIGAAFHAIECAKNIGKNNAATKNESNQPVIAVESIPKIDNCYEFTDRTSHGIGIEIYDEESDKLINSVILPKNTIIPAEAQKDFCTSVDYQEEIELTVRQGETSELKYTTEIGETILKLRPKPVGSPIRVVVSCDTDSIVHVHVIDLEDNEDLGEMKIERVSNLSEEEVKISQSKLGKLNIGWE